MQANLEGTTKGPRWDVVRFGCFSFHNFKAFEVCIYVDMQESQVYPLKDSLNNRQNVWQSWNDPVLEFQ